MSFRTDVNDGIACIEVSHGKANALDLELCHALTDELERLGPDARSLVITGAGRIFSAGVDLRRLSEEGEDYTRRFLPALDRLILTLFQFPRPVVAAINGHAIAGGCVLACAADYRLMAEGAFKIGVPELAVGVPFPPAALETLRFAAPERYVQELTQGEKMYTPAEAGAHGLVHQVVPPPALMASALKEAGRLASLQPRAFSLTKAISRRPVVDRIAHLNQEYAAAVLAAWLEPDTRSAIKRYVEATLRR
ncbi:MAG: enoyl-CoA hydratase/isomerase family protein [Deltaproteobacteria bacterium]|nr:enoyl-CoA hydratase/isomerase family protein [Deltaproteobacteria bacterium]